MNTISVDPKMFANVGETLFRWLGMFWTNIFENPDLVKSFTNGQGILAAQHYLNFLENISLIDRNTVPVFHRERWKPFIIKRSQADSGTATSLKLGTLPIPNVGPQTENAFIPGKSIKVGGAGALINVVTYPISGADDVLTCIADNILLPTTVLVRGTDFFVHNGAIFFHRKNDPFSLGFPTRAMVDADGNEDQEILLWGSDALIDNQFVYNHLGAVFGFNTISTEFYRRLINALWDLYNSGTPRSLFYSGVGAILGEPTVIHAEETVDSVIYTDDGIKIATDQEVYSVAPTATLRDAIVSGAVLRRGEFFTTTVRIYNHMDMTKSTVSSEYAELFKTDVYSMFFGKPLLRSNVEYGIGASFELSDIVVAGLDRNAAPKLKFDLYGLPADIDLFWDDFWQYLEDSQLTSETCFSDYLDDIVLPEVGRVCGRVAPLEYFFRYFLSTNSVVIVVNRGQLTEPATDRDSIGMLQLLTQVIPAHICLFVVEQRYPEPENYLLTDVTESIETTYSKSAYDFALAGGPSKIRLTYVDRPPIIKQIPVCL